MTTTPEQLYLNELGDKREIAALREEIARWTDYAATLENERSEAKAEIARLQEVLYDIRITASRSPGWIGIVDKIYAALKGKGEG